MIKTLAKVIPRMDSPSDAKLLKNTILRYFREPWVAYRTCFSSSKLVPAGGVHPERDKHLSSVYGTEFPASSEYSRYQQ